MAVVIDNHLPREPLISSDNDSDITSGYHIDIIFGIFKSVLYFMDIGTDINVTVM